MGYIYIYIYIISYHKNIIISSYWYYDIISNHMISPYVSYLIIISDHIISYYPMISQDIILSHFFYSWSYHCYPTLGGFNLWGGSPESSIRCSEIYNNIIILAPRDCHGILSMFYINHRLSCDVFIYLYIYTYIYIYTHIFCGYISETGGRTRNPKEGTESTKPCPKHENKYAGCFAHLSHNIGSVQPWP